MISTLAGGGGTPVERGRRPLGRQWGLCLTANMNSDDRDDPVVHYRHSGDPLADACVDSVAAELGLGGVGQLLDKILDLTELPVTDEFGQGYLDYLDESSKLPDWFDPERLGDSAEFFNVHGWTAFSIFGCAALPEGYAVAEVSQVLGTTQALVDHVHRRLWQTIQFVIDVTDEHGLTVDPADPSRAAGIGAKHAQKVRLFHAIIRYFLARRHQRGLGATQEETPYAENLLSREWDSDVNGMPINQAQMAGTQLTFSYIVLRGLKTLGHHVDDTTADAYIYRWNVIGHLMGVDHELMRDDYATAGALWDDLRRPDLTADGQALMDALLEFMYSMVPWWLFFLRPTAPMLIVHLIGEQHAREVGLRLTLGQRIAMPLLRGSMAIYAKVFGHSNAMQGLSAWLYLRMRRNMIGQMRDGRRRFKLPDGTPGAREWLRS